MSPFLSGFGCTAGKCHLLKWPELQIQVEFGCQPSHQQCNTDYLWKVHIVLPVVNSANAASLSTVEWQASSSRDRTCSSPIGMFWHVLLALSCANCSITMNIVLLGRGWKNRHSCLELSPSLEDTLIVHRSKSSRLIWISLRTLVASLFASS